jgi:site-specific recombinase XerD
VGQVLAFPGNAAPGFERAAAAFIDAHTAGPGAWTGGTAKKYRETFAALTLRLRGSVGEHLAALDTEPGRVSLKTAFADAFDHLAPATYARHLSALRSAIRWWKDANWITGDPTAGWARPKVPVDKTRALSRSRIEALFRLDAPLREKTRPSAHNGTVLGVSSPRAVALPPGMVRMWVDRGRMDL